MSKTVSTKIEEAIKIIEKSSNIFIASHINPDGDNIGSVLALTLALIKRGKAVFALESDRSPSNLSFLPGFELMKKYDDDMGDVDTFITLDSSDPDRLGDNILLIDKANHVINIDHHKSNTNFGNINIVDTEAAATGELIFDIIQKLDIDMDKNIATNIYAAISTDTGSFRYGNVNSKTHRIAATLLETGIDLTHINIELYENMSMAKASLFIKTINKLKTYEDGKIAVIKITQDMLEETSTDWEDTEGIISFIRQIDSVEVSCLMKEYEKEETRISLRSKKYADVSLICSAFDGGGHMRAAGCTIYKDIDSAESTLINKIKDVLG